MMLRMSLSGSIRKLRHGVEDTFDFAAQEGRAVLRNIGLVSAGVTVLALGVVVGSELRRRYKFSRRTPYDFYAHAGEGGDLEFGVGT
jgi:hypothetical protein